MKYKIGSIWKSRGGDKARVICNDRNYPNFPLVVLIERNGMEQLMSLRENGNIGSFCCNDDLVEPWVDKPKWDWSNISPWYNYLVYDGERWELYSDKPIMKVNTTWKNRYWMGGSEKSLCERVPEKYAPNWNGKPEDSLVCRPGFD